MSNGWKNKSTKKTTASGGSYCVAKKAGIKVTKKHAKKTTKKTAKKSKKR
jgi:hypothetical protein